MVDRISNFRKPTNKMSNHAVKLCDIVVRDKYTVLKFNLICISCCLITYSTFNIMKIFGSNKNWLMETIVQFGNLFTSLFQLLQFFHDSRNFSWLI